MLEANPIPGLTDTSLLPQAAEAAGIGFDALVARMLELALQPDAQPTSVSARSCRRQPARPAPAWLSRRTRSPQA